MTARLWRPLVFACAAMIVSAAAPRAAQVIPDAPVMVIETMKGNIEIKLYKADAPKSVEQLVKLMRRSFYRGQRFHRATSSLVQIGDPQSRDMSRKAYWGTGNSG